MKVYLKYTSSILEVYFKHTLLSSIDSYGQSILQVYLKYTSSILEVYFKYILQVYFTLKYRFLWSKYISSILEVYFEYTSSILGVSLFCKGTIIEQPESFT